MERSDFYQTHLNRVSRSFAFCIANLRSPMRAWVGLTYLLCRVLDTVEDAPWKSSEQQIRQFQQFDQFLMTKPTAQQVKEWARCFPSDIPDGEKMLLEDSHLLFMDIHDSPESIREIVAGMVKKMSQGMRRFSERRGLHQTNRLRLSSLDEVNEYCFFVAGVVGEALAQILAQVEPRFQVFKTRIRDAHHFGLFLQKVNILKDQNVDSAEGRDFVFDRTAVRSSMSLDAYGAFRFLNDIPLHQREFRQFCAWSFFLGLASLPLIESAFLRGSSGKLSREDAEEIFDQITLWIDDPNLVKQHYVESMKGAGLRIVSDSEYEMTIQNELFTRNLPVESLCGV